MEILSAALLAVIQGVTELFPVSSLGHAVILPAILNMTINLRSPEFLPFLVVMHCGTAVALLLYFWRDWRNFLFGALDFTGRANAGERRLFFLVCFATAPAVIIGYMLKKLVRDAFATPVLAAAFLIVNGVVLLIGERLKGRGSHPLDDLGWKGAIAVGFAQCLAFVPGLSRSGLTLAAGLAAGLRHEAAARLSFLLATPIIIGATVLEAPKVLHSGATLHNASIVAGIIAAATAYASVAFLMRYFRRHEFNALNPFAYYCLAAGLTALGFLLAH
jgi:undecaprenyl-diphosphatase